MRALATRAPWAPFLGRTFLGPWPDYLLIGAAISVPFIVWAVLDPSITPTDFATQTAVFLIVNNAHFASSTVRLYSKPGSVPARRFAFYTLPIVTLALTSLCILWPDTLGKHLWALSLTWSPYHYAMQAYGLALLYCYRSGVSLKPTEKNLFRLVCLLPFVRAMFVPDEERGIAWVSHAFGLGPLPFNDAILSALTAAVFAVPVLAAIRLRGRNVRLPLIAWVLVTMNGIWWVVLSYTDAWFWASIFHSIQYLVIIVIFHVNDQMKRPNNKRTRANHALGFYTKSVILGVVLFFAWPWLYILMGASIPSALLLTAAAINLHHFIVDGFIWRSPARSKSERMASG